MGAIKREMNSPKWTLFAIGYMTIFAYAISFMVYQFGAWFFGGGSVIGTILAGIVLALFLYLLFRPYKEEHKTSSGPVLAVSRN